jgi:hypothetical protein
MQTEAQVESSRRSLHGPRAK